MDQIFLGLNVTGTLFNIFVIHCAFKLFKRFGDTIHLFILSMTLGDFILTGNSI